MTYMEETKSLGPHPDYSKNLETSKTLIENWRIKLPDGHPDGQFKSKLPNGMSVRLVESGGQSGTIPQSILNIAFAPPPEETNCKKRFCNPIFLHQGKQTFDTEISNTFTHYMNGVKALEAKRPRMIQADLLAGKA